jgi:hypothetical protein
MNPGLLLLAFLAVCFTSSAPGGVLDALREEAKDTPKKIDVERMQVVNQPWLSNQSAALLDIIRILYRATMIRGLDLVKMKISAQRLVSRKALQSWSVDLPMM